MFFQAEILTPKNTLPTAPLITRLVIYPGMATEEWVGFPRGCAGLAHMQIWYWGTQIWPYTPQTSFHWDEYVFNFHDRYPFLEEPLELVIKTWNLDDSFPHELLFALTIEPAPPEEEIRDLRRSLQMLGLLKAG